MTGGRASRPDLLGRAPSRFVRVVVIPPRSAWLYVDADWRDRLVEVDRGELELELLGGRRCHFSAGAVLYLVGLRVRTLQNRTTEPTVLVTASRR